MTTDVTYLDLAKGWRCKRLQSEWGCLFNCMVYRGSFKGLRDFVVVFVPKEEAPGFEGFGLMRRGFGLAWSREGGSCYTGEKLYFVFLSLLSLSSISLCSLRLPQMMGHVKTTLILLHTKTHRHPKSIQQITFMWWLWLHSGDLTVVFGYIELIVFHALFANCLNIFLDFVLFCFSAGVYWH